MPSHTVEARAHGWRLDYFLARLYPNHSRSSLQKAIAAGGTRVNGVAARPSRRLHVNDRIDVTLPEKAEHTIPPEELPLSILHEDETLVVLDKAAGMIVHPGRGNPNGTLAAALQFHFDKLSDAAGEHRPGIVHRLDRDTTGVLVVAKDNQTHHRLSRQFEQRTVQKQYLAIVRGGPQFDADWIETHVRTHPRQRERMQVCGPGGEAREANTFYEVAERLGSFSLMRLFPKTGRTHQLRVHMQHLGHPILADRAYGGGGAVTPRDLGAAAGGRDGEVLIDRQALHAHELTFDHPATGERMTFSAPLPGDMQAALAVLRETSGL